ncbi:MAG: type IV secretion system DNA-binding domain-containing protein [Pseudomonadota bacterium]
MSIIRGSQLIGHSFRMGGQSFRSLIFWTLSFFLLCWIAIACFKIDHIHIHNIKQGFRAWQYLVQNQQQPIKLIDRGVYEAIEQQAKARNIFTYELLLEYKTDPRFVLVAPNRVGNHPLLTRENDNIKHILLHSAVHSLLISLGGIVLLICWLKRYGKDTQTDEFLRGNRLVSDKALTQLINKYNLKQQQITKYYLANIPYPINAETEHSLIVGSTGSGKTVLLKSLVKQLKQRGDKVLIYDYTGSFTASFYNHNQDTIINPFDERGKSWSLLKEISQEAEFDTIANALINQKHNITDPFWPNGARLIFTELCRLQHRRGDYSSNNLYQLLALPFADLEQLLANTPAAQFFKPDSSKTTMSLLMLLATHLKGLQYIDDSNSYFSIKDWLLDTDDKSTVFLTSKSNLHASIQPLIAAIMDIATNNIGELSLHNQQRTWFIFDELPSINYLPSLKKALATARNYGVCFVLGIQSVNQLYDIYGKSESHAIISNCKNKLIMNLADTNAAEWASNTIGRQEIEKYSQSLSYGAHQVRDDISLNKVVHEKQLVLPSEIMSLPKLTGYCSMSGDFPTAKIKFKLTQTCRE